MLASHNLTGKKLAIKILPRVSPFSTNGHSNQSMADHASNRAFNEIRALREAAISTVLYHPHICCMHEMIIHPHRYYIVSEYVHGVQMLDYIISHGKLRQVVARKFARQICSALDYCHSNNVVHRDLKMENIFVSQMGNIKITDYFGLSNFYDPFSQLSTACGSSYFPAPELLCGKAYTGPEIDIWSFGVILYVLVCRKVPFDDQSIDNLHAKIKRGLVDYPKWLGAECKHFLSRMLVVNPAFRAQLAEVLNHPWMRRGFSGPPVSYLIHRKPLRADELDQQVICRMQGFYFGSEDDIENNLVQLLESDLYAQAVEAWECRQTGGRNFLPPESESDSLSATSSDGNCKTTSQISPSIKQKMWRFLRFEFCRRKLFSTGSSWNSRWEPNNFSVGNTNREPLDPTRSFHPLLSMYYLYREKFERERSTGVNDVVLFRDVEA